MDNKNDVTPEPVEVAAVDKKALAFAKLFSLRPSREEIRASMLDKARRAAQQDPYEAVVVVEHFSR